mmetsp:Transcript_68135/g.152667  ORF Transcript_68135/g.152667 Transcript_68135/m.152667 type:complete len:279 (+) Transcript_68135:84-920(+)
MGLLKRHWWRTAPSPHPGGPSAGADGVLDAAVVGHQDDRAPVAGARPSRDPRVRDAPRAHGGAEHPGEAMEVLGLPAAWEASGVPTVLAAGGLLQAMLQAGASAVVVPVVDVEAALRAVARGVGDEHAGGAATAVVSGGHHAVVVADVVVADALHADCTVLAGDHEVAAHDAVAAVVADLRQVAVGEGGEVGRGIEVGGGGDVGGCGVRLAVHLCPAELQRVEAASLLVPGEALVVRGQPLGELLTRDGRQEQRQQEGSGDHGLGFERCAASKSRREC